MKSLTQTDHNISIKYLVALMLIAYLFSFLVRMIWVYQFNDYTPFHHDGELMINTNDGYFFAAGAQTELYGMHAENPRDPNWLSYGVTFLTVLLVKITPFSLETIILYMPAVVSSLVVIPIILISRLYGLTIVGFFAALLGSVAWSYYNRTMIGYFDTDMFAAMAPMFVLFFFLKSVEDYTLKSALYASIAIIIYPFFYDQGRAVVFAMSLLYFAYLFIYHHREKEIYKMILLITLSTIPFAQIVASPYHYLLSIITVIGIYYGIKDKDFSLKTLQITTAGAIILFLFFGNVFSLLLYKITYYLSRDVEEVGLKFFQVNQTVREAGTIPFSTMANRISGSTIGVILALIGYVMLVIRHRAFILALPLIGIGIFSLWGGLRFTVYAVPVAAISAVYLFYLVAAYVNQPKFRYVIVGGFTALMLYPNIMHIVEYKVPTVFVDEEVKVLESLNQIADTKDYTLTWWDYGYPIWYYADTNTLIDGGKHGPDNYIISKILYSDSQLLSANLSRFAVEKYVASDYQLVSHVIFDKNSKPADLITQLEAGNIMLPPKTREIYYYLPNRLLNIFPTVGLFSNLNLETGEKYKQPFYYKADQFKDEGNTILFGNGVMLNKQNSILHIGNQQVPIKRFVIAGYDNQKKLQKNIQMINPNATISIIYMQSYNSWLILDEKLYNSFFIQLFVLEEYDKSLFEPVILNPYAKVFKLKK